MPRPRKPARLYLQPEQRDAAGRLVQRSTWIIRDGQRKRGTGCGPDERRQAEQRLAAYLAENHAPRPGVRHPAQIPVSDAINLYLTDVAPSLASSKEIGRRGKQILAFFGHKRLSDINGRLCREYAASRASPSAARRELEDLRAAINHHRKEGLCAEIVSVVLPPKPAPRERWLTRKEAAALIRAAWRYREVQKGEETDKRPRRHVARFVLVALYTGSRSGAICSAALGPAAGRAWVDLDRGVFYRRAAGERETTKRRPPVRLHGRLLAHLRRWARSQRFVVEWRGEPVRSIRKAFAAAVAEAGLGDEVTPHTLRHTAATWMMQAGVDLWQAAGFLGMTVETLERTYGHHHPDYQSGALRAFDRPMTVSVMHDGNEGTKRDSGRRNGSEDR